MLWYGYDFEGECRVLNEWTRLDRGELMPLGRSLLEFWAFFYRIPGLGVHGAF